MSDRIHQHEIKRGGFLKYIIVINVCANGRDWIAGQLGLFMDYIETTLKVNKMRINT